MDIAKRWYERARLSRDDYDRFIYAYIALNYLYVGERRNGEGERACAVRFACEKCVICQFEPFACDVSEYQRSPVVDMLHTDRCYPVTNQRKGLFEAIYQVRCNLFHGNKCLGDPRDAKLVRQGADVLIGLLNGILKVVI